MRRKSILSKLVFLGIFILSYLIFNYVAFSTKIQFQKFLSDSFFSEGFFQFIEVFLLVIFSYFTANIVVYGRFFTKNLR